MCLMVRCLTPWISFKKKVLIRRKYKWIFVRCFPFWYLTSSIYSPMTLNHLKIGGAVAFMKYFTKVASLIFLTKTSIWNKITIRLLNSFDRVWHDGVICKIKCIGMIGMFLKFITSFLESKLERVVLNGQSSSCEPVLVGEPQGSVLGPLFFLIYINYLLKNLLSNTKLFPYGPSFFPRSKSLMFPQIS